MGACNMHVCVCVCVCVCVYRYKEKNRMINVEMQDEKLRKEEMAET